MLCVVFGCAVSSLVSVLCVVFGSAVSVGFEYEACLVVILWEKRSIALQGYQLDSSSMGLWTLDKHHALDVSNGKIRSAFQNT